MKLIIEQKTGIPSILYKDGGSIIIVEEFSKAINLALDKIKNDLQRKLPKGATGNLQKSLTVDPAKSQYRGKRVVGRVYHRGYGSRYAGVVEFGRSRGRTRPPKGALVRWLMSKGLSEKEARRKDFPVRKAIGEKGVEGKLIWARNMRLYKQMAEKEMSRAMRNVVRRISVSAKGKRRLARLGV